MEPARQHCGQPAERSAVLSPGPRTDYGVISGQQSNFIAAPAGGPRRFDFQNLIDFSIGKRWRLPGNFILEDRPAVSSISSTVRQSISWADYVLNEGDEFIPSRWVKPRRLMLRIGLEY